jgi:hypothetical protein
LSVKKQKEHDAPTSSGKKRKIKRGVKKRDSEDNKKGDD